MANKRGRAKRNKKPNNWKVIAKIRQEKIKNQNSKNDEDECPSQSETALENQDSSQNTQQEIATIFLNIEKDENDDGYETVAKKRRRKCSAQTQSELDLLLSEDSDPSDFNHSSTAEVVCENYFESLSVQDDENENDDGTETQSVNDSFFSDDNADDESYEDEDPFGEIGENIEGLAMNNDENNDANEAGETDDQNEGELAGKRLFNLIELFEQIQRIGRHSRHCNFNDMVLESETRKGLNSILKFRCGRCGCLRKIESCPKKPNNFTVNEEAVLGITSIGSGYSHLSEFYSNHNVPVMGHNSYDKIQQEQQKDWENVAKLSALEALREEIEIAITTGSVDSKGNALIAVICDGGWGKRSYGKAFNSLSGCAVLIGVKTKKVVFFGTRNKYCHVCKLAESKGVVPREHDCNINYTGPSSGMEANIILEGFKCSEEHGVRYFKLIADGDSNTYKLIRDSRIYRLPDLFVEKFECVNHLCRNFRKKFTFLNSVTKFNSNLRRKHITSHKAQDICKGVKTAAKHWRDSNLNMTEKINLLEEDVMNAPNHYFGVHDKCKSYFCNKATQQGAIDNLKLLKDDGLYYEVLNLCQTYFAFHAKSLIMNHTNNAAEEFNNVVAKFLGGKRINYSLAGSYSARIAAAVVQYNSKGHVGSEFRKYKFGDSNNSRIEKLENSRKRKLVQNEIARQAKPRDRRVAQGEISNSAYFHGDGSEDVDMEPDKFEKAKELHFKKLHQNQHNWRTVEQSTIGGRTNERWQQIRQDLIPSSFFSKIIKAKNRTSYTNHLDELLYKRSEFGNSAESKHQRLVERDAINVFESLFDDGLTRSGLFIDKKFSYLCASPLRLCGKDHLLNIKCPVKQYNKKFDDVIDEIPLWIMEHGHLEINKNCHWYIELQADIHITRRKYGYIMVWLGEFEGEPQYRIVIVPKDDAFFNNHIAPKLIYFYNQVMVKELVNPRNGRQGRNMPLRVYDAEKELFI